MVDHIKEIIQSIRLPDIIDIGIIATFIYFFLVWFKKARARFILIGMFILSSIYILARLFSLYLTTLVFQAFFAIFLILIVVIFQDDIRHFFERIAIWGITRRYRQKTSFGQEIDILSSALANLSRKQNGALIVIRGRDPLERYLGAGTNLDGLLNQVVLESIFSPSAPSHDGAVIIDRGRIIRFGCHLPLSTNIQEVGYLGTRHAAALGLAERTDCLCIVVSEETGTISIAEEGKIRQLDNITELPKILEGFYRNRFPVKKNKSFVEFLTGHSLEKIIALALACGFWLAFGHRIEIIQRDFVIPIEYRNLASDWIIEEPRPRDITVTLSGTERAFNLFNPRELKLSLDMSEVKGGVNKFYLTEDLIRYPSGLSIVNIQPGEIQFKIYKMLSFNVPIKLETEGVLPRGFFIQKISIEPEELEIIAPSITPQERLKITTEPVNLKGLTETKVFTPKLIIPSDFRLPQDKIPEVKVTIEVKKKGS